jgi:putative membrane protein
MQDTRRVNRQDEGNWGKGLVAGVIGGLIASWTMNQFQALWSRKSVGVERSHGAQSLQQGSPGDTSQEKGKAQGSGEESDDATERVASAISKGVFGQALTKGEKEVAGVAVHYVFGTTTGALYGAAAELVPSITTGAGLPFGAAVWFAADEAVLPALGLSKPAAEYPLSTHAYALASHLVYGLTTEIVRRAVRRAW